jgi:hypothetical protein
MKNVGVGMIEIRRPMTAPYSSIFTLLRWRHDFLTRFLSIETTETEKKAVRLFIVGYFVVILCSCQFDNF